MRSIGRNPTERRQRGSQPDERRIRQGIAQVAGEAVGRLAGLLNHLAAESILPAVRFIRDDHDLAHLRSAHNMRNLSFLRGDSVAESQIAGRKLGCELAERSVVEVPQNEAAERERPKGGADGYPAVLILAER